MTVPVLFGATTSRRGELAEICKDAFAPQGASRVELIDSRCPMEASAGTPGRIGVKIPLSFHIPPDRGRLGNVPDPLHSNDLRFESAFHVKLVRG